MINFIICSTEKAFSDLCSNVVEKFFMNYDVSYKCHYCSNYEKDLDNYIKADLEFKVYILCGIINEVTYLDVARKIREENDDWTSIILVVDSTNTYKYSVFSARLQILDYINRFDNFKKELDYNLEKCIKIYDNRPRSLKIKHYNYNEVVLYKDIIYIEKVKDSKCCNIKTIYGDKTYTGTLTYLYQKLNDKRFIKTHQSFIVNKDYIDDYYNKENIIKLKNSDDVILVSKNYKKEIKEYFETR